MSAARRSIPPRRRRSVRSIVIRTVLVSVAVLAVGFALGLALGRVLL